MSDMDCGLADARTIGESLLLSHEAIKAMLEVCVNLWDDMECSRLDGGHYNDGADGLIRAVREHPDLNALVSARHHGMNGKHPSDRYPVPSRTENVDSL